MPLRQWVSREFVLSFVGWDVEKDAAKRDTGWASHRHIEPQVLHARNPRL